MSCERQISHDILDEVSEESDTFGNSHFVCLDHLNGKFDAIKGFSSIKHHSGQ